MATITRTEGEDGSASRHVLTALRPRMDGARWQWLRRKVVGAWMNALIAIAAASTVVTASFVANGRHWPDPDTWASGALKLFALWCLSFLPGWLYVRFLSLRAKALWTEYVLTLHRLGWDQPRYLPKPPWGSEFRGAWQPDLADRTSAADNIYRQKFEAYYGRQVVAGGLKRDPRGRYRLSSDSDAETDENYVVATESLFPLFLATAVLAVGWATVLWDTSFLTDPSGVWDAMKYGFLGAYAYVTSMLVRRFFQSDLRPSVYATAVFRIVLVLIVVAVVHQTVGATGPTGIGSEAAIAFLIGFFPLVGVQLLERAASKVFRVVVPPLTPDYPLDQLDGLNLWYEARLAEEGVEDMQNLTTMNLVDVVLHTRVPPGRLVDWLDQAFLLLHLRRTDRADLRRARRSGDCERRDGAADRLALREVGVRTATDLLKVFSEDAPGRPGERIFRQPADGERLPLPPAQLELLVRVLAAEPGLAPVWNWQHNGVRVHRNEGRRLAARA